MNKRFVVTVCLSLLLMVADQKYDAMRHLRSNLSLVLYPLYYVVHEPVRYAGLIRDRLRSQQSLLENVHRLRQDRLQMQAKVQRMEALRAENQRLRELLDSARTIGQASLVAELLSIDTQSSRQQMILNKGTSAGVYVGQPVVDAHGILGQVIYAGALTSTVLLLTDTRHALPVLISRSGVRAVVNGDGDDGMYLEHLPDNFDLRLGDLVISSGLGDRFPANYPVGWVSHIEKTKRGPARATVRPAAQVRSGQEFLLVQGQDHSDG